MDDPLYKLELTAAEALALSNAACSGNMSQDINEQRAALSALKKLLSLIESIQPK